MSEIAKHNTQEDCWLVIGNEKTGEFHVLRIVLYFELYFIAIIFLQNAIHIVFAHTPDMIVCLSLLA